MRRSDKVVMRTKAGVMRRNTGREDKTSDVGYSLSQNSWAAKCCKQYKIPIEELIERSWLVLMMLDVLKIQAAVLHILCY